MQIDFHCHHAMPNAIVCTDRPQCVTGPALLSFQGLLPSRWTKDCQDNLLSLLAKDPDLHMGEIGLDDRFKGNMDMDSQVEVLGKLLGFAKGNRRLVSLHCVHATGKMVKALESLKPRPFSILWHGFSGSAETAMELARLNVLVSIGPRFKGDIRSIYRANGNMVIETDYEGQSTDEHTGILANQYTQRAGELGMDIKGLEDHCMRMLELFKASVSDVQNQ